MERFFSSLKRRLNEPSTYAGLAVTIGGLGQVLDFDEAPAIADTVTQAGQHMATGDWISAAAVAIFGGLAILKSEKGR